MKKRHWFTGAAFCLTYFLKNFRKRKLFGNLLRLGIVRNRTRPSDVQFKQGEGKKNMEKSFMRCLLLAACLLLTLSVSGCGEDETAGAEPQISTKPGITTPDDTQTETRPNTTVTAPEVPPQTAPVTTTPTPTAPAPTTPAPTTPKPTTPAPTTPKPTTPTAPTTPVVTTPTTPTTPAVTTPTTPPKPTTPTVPTTPPAITTPTVPNTPEAGGTETIYYNVSYGIVDEKDPTAYYVMVTEYDDQRRPISRDLKIISGMTPVYVMDWTYHADGKETEETTKYMDGVYDYADKSVKDANGRQIEYIYYDEPGVPSFWSETVYNSDGSSVEKNYDSDGSKSITVRNKNGIITKSEGWTSEGTYVFGEYYESGEDKYSKIEYPDGRLQEKWKDIDGTVTAEKSRNADGSRWEHQNNENGDLVMSVSYDANGNKKESTKREYHNNGKISKQIYENADGTREECIYNTNGICIKKTTTHTDSASQNIIEYADNGVIARELLIWGDGDVTEIIYNTSGKKQKQIEHSADGSRVESEYNSQEKVTKETYFDTSGNRQGIRVYEYVGNRVSKEIYYYPEGGRMEEEHNATGQLVRRCMYDSTGKMTSEEVNTYYPTGIQKTTVAYDADRNYTKYTYYEDGGSEMYQYTADDKLTKKQVTKKDLSGFIEEYDENGLLELRFVHGPDFDYTTEEHYTYRADGTLESAKIIDRHTRAYDIIEYAEDGKTQVKVTKYDSNDKVIG